MRHSEKFGEIAAALAAAQGKMDHAAKDRNNPAFKSKYADLASVLDACRPHLSAHEIAIVQPPALVMPDEQKIAGVVRVETWLIHKSGEWFSTSIDAAVPDIKAQTIGSAITYLRRYGLSAMAGIAPDDDDGNGASGPTTPSRAREMEQPAPAPAPASKPTPAEGAAMAARSFPSLKPQVDAIAADPTLSDEDKHTAIKSLVRLEKARAAGAPSAAAPATAPAAPPLDPKVVAEVRRLLLAADHADPGERAEVAAIMREYSRGSGRIEDVGAADLPKLASELEALLNGAAVAA